ncbi:L-isoaspartyl protein carboxyl methyltransferase type II [Salmonella enterica subsp. enterica serovar Heidelberg]|nr:L-isoaspartyl protein carboxyl methyltransferase type II [Salmonella enterica subsp. enterica serovar Heidelberg]
MVSGRVQALLEQLRAQGIRDEQVLNALAAVPREKFIDEAFEHKAWENIALPIGQGQTISQPYMVARMTETARTDAAIQGAGNWHRFRLSDGDSGASGTSRLLR